MFTIHCWEGEGGGRLLPNKKQPFTVSIQLAQCTGSQHSGRDTWSPAGATWDGRKACCENSTSWHELNILVSVLNEFDLSNFVLQEVCNKEVVLHTAPYPRSRSRFKKVLGLEHIAVPGYTLGSRDVPVLLTVTCWVDNVSTSNHVTFVPKRCTVYQRSTSVTIWSSSIGSSLEGQGGSECDKKTNRNCITNRLQSKEFFAAGCTIELSLHAEMMSYVIIMYPFLSREVSSL